jgi:hypothetical protein
MGSRLYKLQIQNTNAHRENGIFRKPRASLSNSASEKFSNSALIVSNASMLPILYSTDSMASVFCIDATPFLGPIGRFTATWIGGSLGHLYGTVYRMGRLKSREVILLSNQAGNEKGRISLRPFSVLFSTPFTEPRPRAWQPNRNAARLHELPFGYSQRNL